MATKKRVLIIDNSVAFTGAFKAALQEAELLSGDARFIFVIPRNSKNISLIQQKGFLCYTMPMREINRSPLNLFLYLPSLFLNYFRLKKIVHREACTIVQVNDFYNLLGAMLKFFGYKGKLITYVRFLPAAVPAILRKIWVWAAHRYSYKVIAVSDAVIYQLPVKANTIRVYDPIELPEKYPPDISSAQPEKTRFLYLANYTRGKGQELAVKAFIEAYRQQKNISLHFYGGDMGLQKNRDFRKELEQQVIKGGLEPVISFHDFATDTESVIKAYDVLLNFSIAESFSMTCAEASFYGRPVIATRCGGPEEIIVHQETGLLVNVNAVDEMSEAMLRLAADPGLRKEMGIMGRQYVRQKFSVAAFRKRFEELVFDN